MTTYCDEIPYWKTSRTSPDTWIAKTVGLLKKLGATAIAEAFARSGGRGAFVLAFSAGGESFRVVWPILTPRRPEDEGAARIQAATLLYHDCKAKVVAAAVLGIRTAFIGALVLPDNRTVADASNPAIAEQLKPLGLIAGPTKRNDE